MSISIGTNDFYSSLSGISSSSSKADSIEATLKNSSATDEELMDACKSFESYLMEQVFKSMESTVDKSEEEENNDYMNQFGDMLYQQVAEDATDNQSIGLAQMLYESMKRNS
jgi:peptidoglycan hydrolase FlgJ